MSFSFCPFIYPSTSQAATVATWTTQGDFINNASTTGEDSIVGQGATVVDDSMKIFSGGSDVLAVATGYQHTLALKGDGEVSGWGENSSEQLGYNTQNSSVSTPTRVPGLENIAKVSAGRVHSLALDEDGYVWGFGGNVLKETGINSVSQNIYPPQKTTIAGCTDISAGDYFSLALKNDGTVWAWGYGELGQLGNGENENSAVPVQVSSLSNVTKIYTRGSGAIALKGDGTAWQWGGAANTPIQIAGLTGISKIVYGWDHSFALKNDGTVWSWGENNFGQLGDGTTTGSETPVQVTVIDNVNDIAAPSGSTIVVKTDGTVWAWGSDGSEVLGNGPAGSTTTPAQIAGLSNMEKVYYLPDSVFAQDDEGYLKSWGLNISGYLGDGTITSRSIPVDVNRYVLSGVVSSLIIDNGHDRNGVWGNILVNGVIPANTQVKLRSRSAPLEDVLDRATWSEYIVFDPEDSGSASANVASDDSRCLEIEITLLNTNKMSTPVVNDINVIYDVEFNPNPMPNMEIGQIESSVADSWADNPVVSGNTIVWLDSRNGNNDIYTKNMLTGVETQITDTPDSERNVDISGTRLVWAYTQDGNGDIYYRDLASSNTVAQRLTTNAASQDFPDIYENYVVYEDNRNGEYDIFLYDLLEGESSELQLTSGPDDQTRPAIYGDNIVWLEDVISISWVPRKLYRYSIATGEASKLNISEVSKKYRPDIHDKLVVWHEEENATPPHIASYDLDTNTFSWITQGLNVLNRRPQASEKILSWQEDVAMVVNLYFRDSDDRIQISPVGQSAVKASVGDNYAVWVDSDTSLINYAYFDFPDDSSPVISNANVTGISKTSAKITWNTDDLSTSVLEYGETESYGQSVTASATLKNSHSYTLTNLKAETKYHFRLKATNGDGLLGISDDYYFITSKNFVFDQAEQGVIISNTNISGGDSSVVEVDPEEQPATLEPGTDSSQSEYQSSDNFIERVLTLVNSAVAEVVKNTPEPVARTFPYVLFAVLLVSAYIFTVQARKEAEQASQKLEMVQFRKVIAEEKSNFVILVSHYLRTPLTLISSGIDEMFQGKKGVKAEAINKANKHLVNTIQQIVADIEKDTAFNKIKNPNLRTEGIRAYASPFIIIPAMGIAGLVIYANYLFRNVANIQLGTVNLITQGVAFVVAIQIFAYYLRQKMNQHNNLKYFNQTIEYQVAVDEARTELLVNAKQKVSAAVADLKHDLGKEKNEYVDEGLKRMGAILDKMGYLATLKFDDIQKSKSAIDLQDLTESVVNKRKAEIATKKIKTKVVLGGLKTHDSSKIVTAIISEVVDNAIKFSPEAGNVVVKGETREGLNRIIISDQGRGISKREQLYIFKPFSRTSSALNFEYEGIGLGLYYARSLSNMLGGEVYIKSVPEKGTEVTIVL